MNFTKSQTNEMNVSPIKIIKIIINIKYKIVEKVMIVFLYRSINQYNQLITIPIVLYSSLIERIYRERKMLINFNKIFKCVDDRNE